MTSPYVSPGNYIAAQQPKMQTQFPRNLMDYIPQDMGIKEFLSVVSSPGGVDKLSRIKDSFLNQPKLEKEARDEKSIRGQLQRYMQPNQEMQTMYAQAPDMSRSGDVGGLMAMMGAMRQRGGQMPQGLMGR